MNVTQYALALDGEEFAAIALVTAVVAVLSWFMTDASGATRWTTSLLSALAAASLMLVLLIALD